MRTETFNVEQPVRAVVRVPAGRVEIEASPRQTVEVSLEATRGGDELEQQAAIELRGSAARPELVVETPKRRFGLNREEYRVTILLPEDSALDASLASADLRARGRLSEVDLDNASGDVELGEVTGELKAKSASGDLKVERVGDGASVHSASGDIEVAHLGGEGTFRSASGDVVVRQAEAGLGIQTASGDQTIGSAAAGEVVLRSASGDLHVGIKRGSRVHVDARTASGELGSELGLGEEAPAGEGPMVELSAVTASGDVRIVRA